MRKADNGKVHLSSNEKEIRAISFGYDFCSEHEYGFKPKREYLGVKEDRSKPLVLRGKKGRVWKKKTDCLQWVEKDGFAGFGHFDSDTTRDYALDRAMQVKRSKDKELYLWDDRGCVVLSRDKDVQALLKETFDIAKNDPSEMCFLVPRWVGDGAAGLIIGRTKYFEAEFKEMDVEDKRKAGRK